MTSVDRADSDDKAFSRKTIAQLVTPPGMGGLAVIQVIGPDAYTLINPFLKNRTNDHFPKIEPGRLRLVRWMDNAEHIDDVIVVINDTQAHSRSVCISCHGSVRVAERILMCLERAGASVTGELSAVHLWQGLDPIEVTLMNHLPRAQTPSIARWLIRQSTTLRSTIKHCIRLFEQNQTAAARKQIRELIESYQISNMLLEGVQVVIVGPPNAGKSTLANQLFDKPWSVESAEAGTTRDWVKNPVAIAGIPMTLSDTAGLQRSSNELEIQILKESKPLIQNAQVQILVLDGNNPSCEIDREITADLLQLNKILLVMNKSDLPTRLEEGQVTRILAETYGSQQSNRGLREKKDQDPTTVERVVVSALKRQGIDELEQAILRLLNLPDGNLPSPTVWDNLHCEILGHTFQYALHRPEEAIKSLERGFLHISFENKAN